MNGCGLTADQKQRCADKPRLSCNRSPRSAVRSFFSAVTFSLANSRNSSVWAQMSENASSSMPEPRVSPTISQWLGRIWWSRTEKRQFPSMNALAREFFTSSNELRRGSLSRCFSKGQDKRVVFRPPTEIGPHGPILFKPTCLVGGDDHPHPILGTRSHEHGLFAMRTFGFRSGGLSQRFVTVRTFRFSVIGRIGVYVDHRRVAG